VDNDLALKIYIKARATPKVVAAFAERREFDKILIYSKQVCFLVLLVLFLVVTCYTSFELLILFIQFGSRSGTRQIISSSSRPSCVQIHR